MNKIYKIVWSKIKNTYVVVSEVAKSHSKSGQVRGRVTLVAAVLGVLMATALPSSGVYAAELNADQKAVYDAVLHELENNGIHYVSVKGESQNNDSNYKNDGAKGNGAVAIGEKALAAKGGTVSIGRNAHILGNGGNASGEGSVAIGDNSLITTNGLDLASIAIGKNAKVLNGSGKQERVLSFMPDNYTNGDLPDHADKSAGGIAIGTNSYARTGSIQLGHHTFAGYKMGGIDVTNANEEANIVGMTTIGTNTYNKGALANMYGAYSIITGGFTGAGGWNSLSYGSQNFGANVVGSLNSIRSKGHRGSSGIANSIVGVANTVENANGTLVYGAGNKVTNSITSISTPSTLTGSPTWDEMVESLQKGIKDSKSGGAVLAIGGGNVADYVQHSQLVGVNNTVTGTENKVSEFNMVNGYQNTVKNGTHVTMIGSDNEVEDTTGAVLLGDKRKLTGADGSIVLGSADAEADKKVETNVKDATVIGHNANTTVAGGVALGAESKAITDKGIWGVDVSKNAAMTADALLGDKKAEYDAAKTKLQTLQEEEKNLAKQVDESQKNDPFNWTKNKELKEKWEEKQKEVAAQVIEVNNYVKTWQSTEAAVSVGDTDKGITRQITGVAAGTEDTDAVNVAQLKALSTKVDKGGVHYFSVKSTDEMANYDNKGAQGERSVAIGPGSTTKFRNGLSVGTNNVNEGYETTVVGSLNKAYGMGDFKYASDATLVGTNNTVMGYKGVMALGSGNIVHEGIAIGVKNKAMGENAVALGDFSSAMYTDSIGIGFGTHSYADDVIAIGRAAAGDALGGVAIGRDAEVHASTGVALGFASTSEREAGVVGYMPGAVGQTAEEVAAYLGKAEEYKSWKADVEANKDAYTRYKAWHAAVDAERKAYNEVNEARIAYAEKSTEENKKAITEKYDAWKKARDHRQETDVAMRPDFKTIDDLNARYGQIFGKLLSTEGAVSVGDEKTGRTRQIINVAAGTKDTDAVNVYQLKVVNAKADKNAEAITNLTNTVNANGKATIVKVDGNENNADGNLKIKKTKKDGQLTYDLSLNDEISLGKAGEDGKDGKIGLTGKDGTSAEIRTGQGKAGVDGKDGETTTRIIYKDKGVKDHEVATLDDGLKFKGDNDTVVTRKLNEQLNITGGITDAKELSDNNIGVVGTQDGGMAVKLSKKLKGLTSAEFKDGDNVTNITAGDVTVTKKEGNETKTVNIWDLNKTVNDIKTGATDVSSWKLQANGKDERIIKKNDIVNFKNGTNTEVTVSGNDITVDLNKKTKDQIQSNTTKIDEIGGKVTTIENNIKNIDQKIEGAKITVEGDKETGVKVKNTAEAGKPVNYKVSLDDKVKVGNVTIDGTGEGADSKGEITGLTNKTLDSDDFATKGRAATEEQLKAAMAQAVAQGTTTVKAGDQNISVVKTENKNEYTVKLAKDITVDSVTAKTVKADEYKVGDKTYINKDGINANGNKITNVGDGKISKDSTDAVNGKQLYGVEQKVNQNTTNINKLQNNIYDMGMKVGELDTRVNKVGAGAAALAALHPLDFDPDDKWDFAAGYGNYKGANAAAIGAYYRPNEDTMFSVGGSFGGGENMVNAGVSVKLGQGNHVSTSKVAMAKDMLAMQKRMAEMEAQMAKMQGFIGALTGMDTQAAMFPDVPENHWAYEYVKGLCEKGIIEGYPDGNFNGNRSMTRYEFAAMLYRALAKGVNLDARAVKEFAPELGRIRVDVISQNKEGQPVIERVRVNEEKKEK